MDLSSLITAIPDAWKLTILAVPVVTAVVGWYKSTKRQADLTETISNTQTQMTKSLTEMSMTMTEIKNELQNQSKNHWKHMEAYQRALCRAQNIDVDQIDKDIDRMNS